MANCPGFDDDEAQRRRLADASLDAWARAAADRDELPQDEGAAPRQALLHTFSTPIGGILLVSGLVMVVLPGPSFPLLAGGLVLLSREYEWARRLLDVVSRRVPVGWRRYLAGARIESRAPDAGTP